ncbi:uncharacterized protein LOC121415931 [Lytechinus variegatus]|uniref:uncharacterized protein LOC121415931 n=1 Tax=Lytechinus variegatus TaxID=7654 RepID=UPI001BB240B9|nr:uncharacterized protein LOC121415931 [Lytechinus variegatus]
MKMNECSGTPGTNNFRYKLPKYVTKTSLERTVKYFEQTFRLTVENESTGKSQYIYETLCSTFPHLNKDIRHHFAKHELESRHIELSENALNQRPYNDISTLNRVCHCSELNTKLRELQSQVKSLSSCIDSLLSAHSSLDNDRINNIADEAVKVNQNQDPIKSPTYIPSGDVNNPFHPLLEDNGDDLLVVSTKSQSDQLSDYREKHQKECLRLKHIEENKERMKANVLIIGDSMLKPIKPSTLSSSTKVICKTISGAKIDDPFDPTQSLANKHNVKEVILHIGGNNIPINDAMCIATKVESLGSQILAKCPTVTTITISSIISRRLNQRETMEKISLANSLLLKVAENNGWNYINNENIHESNHLSIDGVHLNARGASVFAINLSQHVNGISSSDETVPLAHVFLTFPNVSTVLIINYSCLN